MSTNSFVFYELNTRARRSGLTGGASAALKKSRKVMASRNARRGETKSVAVEIAALTRHDALTSKELEAYAELFLQASQLDDLSADDLEFEGVAQNELPSMLGAEASGLPSYLVGALPDWMLSQIQDANGDAFAHLSLFEAKSPSPKAAISMLDELEYA